MHRHQPSHGCFLASRPAIDAFVLCVCSLLRCSAPNWTATRAFLCISLNQALHPLCCTEQQHWDATQTQRCAGYSFFSRGAGKQPLIWFQPKIYYFSRLILLFCLLPWTPQSPLLAVNSTGSLPRNLAATLQDIETKRQLALQQKGNWPGLHLSFTLKETYWFSHWTLQNCLLINNK